MADKTLTREVAGMESRGRLELMATLKIKHSEDFYRVVDFLNRNLKNYNLMFGMTKNGDEVTFSIYEV